MRGDMILRAMRVGFVRQIGGIGRDLMDGRVFLVGFAFVILEV